MKTIEIAWKEFNIDLEAIDARIREMLEETTFGEKYHGNSADVSLRLHFQDSVTEEQISEIQAYMDGLDAESDEAQSYRTAAQVAEAIQTLRDGIPAKTWNQLTAPERKMVLGGTPTKAELIAALAL